MKKRNRALALLTAFVVGVTSAIPFQTAESVNAAQGTYESGRVYDATEAYFKKQPASYSYNGYKMNPFVNCDTYLFDNKLALSEGYALSTADVVKKGDKVVIEFKNPIDSSEYETVSIGLKQVPGNTYYAYYASDDILSSARKKFQIGSYDVEKISFSTALFAEDDGMVRAIILQNKKADTLGQLFVDFLEVGNSPYQLNQEYDATEEFLKKQSGTSYQGMTVVPFGEISTFWDQEAKVEKGSALIASKPEGAALVKGDVLILEFVHEIPADKFPYLNLKMTTTTGSGASFSFYNVSDIKNGKLGEAKAKGDVAFWKFDAVSLPTKAFADENGKVNAVALKLTSSEAATFSVGSFNLTKKPVQTDSSGTVNTGTDTKNQYDATKENIVVQTYDTYKGIKIRPLAGCGTELSGWGVGEGYAVYTSDAVKKGDVIVIEFVKPIDSKKVDIITMSMKQTPGYSYSAYKGNDTKLSKKVKTVDFGSYDIEKTSFRTSLFAEKDGMVRALILKCEKAGEAGQIFIDGYSLGKDPYKKGVTYDVDENYIKLQSAGTYKGLAIAPFGERTKFWSEEAKVDSDKGYGVVAHRVDNTDLKKNDLMILEFVTDINVNKFEVLNLTLATAAEKGAILEVYNVSEIKDGKLGTPKQRVTADFWSFRTNNISLKALADENGYVGAIGLRLLSDSAQTFTVGSFSLGSLSDLVEKDAPQILDNKITVFETADAYEFTIEFNSTGTMSGTYNEKTVGDLVSFNGVKLNEINKDKTNITLSVDLMGRYCMTLRVDKDYKGKGKVINTERHFVGNYVQIEKGFQLPNGEKLEETYALHVYLTDSVTNIVEDEALSPIGINYLTSGLDDNKNLTINVYFNNQITGNPMYFLCNPDSFNKKDVAKLNGETILYDENMAEAFIYGGYKSALLDHVKINGNTLAEWMAMDEIKGSPGYNTAVMVHYGQMGDKVASIIITANTKIGKILNKSYKIGELHVLLEEGLKFTSGRAVLEDAAYAYDGTTWAKVSADAFAVYYDGQKVEDGDELVVEKLVSVDNISVLGDGDYKIEESVNGNQATYTIFDGKEKKLTFTVTGSQMVPTYSNKIPYIPLIVGGVVILSAVGIAGVLILKGRRKKHAEEKAD